MPTTISTQSSTLSQKDNIIDLCTTAGELFSKFSLLLRDLHISSQPVKSDEIDQQAVGWDEQSVTMFRQAVQTFAINVRDISTVVAEKRIRER